MPTYSSVLAETLRSRGQARQFPVRGPEEHFGCFDEQGHDQGGSRDYPQDDRPCGEGCAAADAPGPRGGVAHVGWRNTSERRRRG